MFSEAVRHHQSGRLPQAERLYRRILRADPKHADSLHLLGLMACQVGRSAEAVELIGEAISLKENDPVAHNNLGNALQQVGRTEEALAHFQRALALGLDIAEAHNNLGNALKELGRAKEAIEHFQRALALKPGMAEVHNNLGNALRAEERLAEAVVQFHYAIGLNPGYAEAHNNLGNVLRDLGRLAEARTHYQRAAALKPDFAGAFHNLGNIHRDEGALEAAEAAYETAISLAPGNALFYRHLVDMRRVTPEDRHFLAMQALARDSDTLGINDKRELHFGLGKALADLGEYDASFHHLLAGNAIKRKQISYDEAATLGALEGIRTAFTHDVVRQFKNRSDAPPAAPIFILGMPRSGTTLVEQVLASHPAAFGAGELPHFEEALSRITDHGVERGLPQAIAALAGDRLDAVATAYLQATRALSAEGKRIIDKMPANYRFVGMIHLALPNARIIHLRRDPRDTCLSCFSLQFERGHLYSYDLGELGRYHRAYAALMQHWRDVLPSSVMLEVQYEDVVSNLEEQARRILAFCDLPWDEACLSFHKTARPVRTASSVQVRQPLYRSAVGRWRAYGTLLKPLLAALGMDAAQF